MMVTPWLEAKSYLSVPRGTRRLMMKKESQLFDGEKFDKSALM